MVAKSDADTRYPDGMTVELRNYGDSLLKSQPPSAVPRSSGFVTRDYDDSLLNSFPHRTSIIRSPSLSLAMIADHRGSSQVRSWRLLMLPQRSQTSS